MSWSIALVLGVCVFTVHSAVHRAQDAKLKRIARSPHYGSSYYHDDFDPPPPPPPHGPPPPPVVYHTQNWSGIAKGLGGATQGVFSGAAASAQSADPALSEAFSLAASGTEPVTTDQGSQTKEDLGKSGLDSHTYRGGSAGHSSGSFEHKYGATNGFRNSDEGQYNIKPLGLELGAGVPSPSESKSGQLSPAIVGFNKNPVGGLSAGYGGSEQFKSAEFGRDSEQRNINSGFGGKSFRGKSTGYESQNSRGDIGSESLSDSNSAGSGLTDNDRHFGQHNLQTSNNGLASFNRQSDQFNAGFGDKFASEAGTSGSQFGQYDGQFLGSGHQRGGKSRGFESHGTDYGVRKEFHGGYGDQNSDTYRQGESDLESKHRFNQNEKQLGDQGNVGQVFPDNSQIRSTGYSASRSSSFGSNGGNYGSGSIGSGAESFGNLDQGKQTENLDAGLTASQGSNQDISDGQKATQLGQLNSGFVASHSGSQELSGKRGQLSTGASKYDYKNSGSLVGENSGALAASNVNSGVSPSRETEGSFPAGFSSSADENVQSTLGGALNLASQGLQTAQRTPCSSCDKSSYALSNAKSHSGSAIALSIGG